MKILDKTFLKREGYTFLAIFVTLHFENRYKRYSKCWEILIAELKRLGLKYLIEDQYHSKLLTSIFIPQGLDFDHMHDFMYERGFTIYPGKVNDYDTFRIANIGALDYRDMEAFLKLLKEYLIMEKIHV